MNSIWFALFLVLLEKNFCIMWYFEVFFDEFILRWNFSRSIDSKKVEFAAISPMKNSIIPIKTPKSSPKFTINCIFSILKQQNLTTMPLIYTKRNKVQTIKFLHNWWYLKTTFFPSLNIFHGKLNSASFLLFFFLFECLPPFILFVFLGKFLISAM